MATIYPVGRRVSTGSKSTRPVHFRVSAEQRRELELAGSKRKPKLSGDLEAKRRLFGEDPPIREIKTIYDPEG